MLPTWQTFPVVTKVRYLTYLHATMYQYVEMTLSNYPWFLFVQVDAPYNWDYRSAVVSKPIDTCISSQRSVLSHTYMIPSPYVIFCHTIFW
jgi:hypothetical protein